MDSRTIGIPLSDPEGYKLTVADAVRVTWGGVYVHSAPWSVGSQGYANVSHGCLNASTENAKWFYDNTKRGDIVEVVNTVGSTLSGTDGLGDWNIPWEQWKAGNATTFVNAPGYPTFNAQTGSPDFTFAKVDSLFKAGTPITQQDNPGTGSKHVYLAKLRGGATYVIVKFLTRDGSNNECSCANKGITTFEYWKIPSSSGGTTNLQAVTLSRPASRIRLGNGSGLLVVDRNGKLSGGLQIVNALGQPLPHQAALFKNLPR